MKKALLALFAIATVTAASAFAADKTDVPAPVVDNGVRPPMERDRGPLPPFPPQLPPHRPVLFSATVATDTPAETINKLTALIPAGQAKHYEVHVEVVPVGEEPTDNSQRRSTLSSVSNKKTAAYRGSFCLSYLQLSS